MKDENDHITTHPTDHLKKDARSYYKYYYENKQTN